MKQLAKYLYTSFYTDLICSLIAVIGLIISIRKRKQYPQLNPLIFFFASYVLLGLINYFIIATKTVLHLKYTIFRYSDFIDTIIEFIAFFFIIKNHIISSKIKKALNPLLVFFTSSIFLYFIYYKSNYAEIDQYFLQAIFTVQASFLIIACILYYMDLFRKEPDLNLANQPSFWVITGVFFFMLCTLPFSLFCSYLFKTNYYLYAQLFSIFNIFYCILFLMIIKAYFCKPETAQ
jgi:hypothetical protein